MEAAINLDFIANYGVFLDAECSKSVRLRLFLESRCYCSAWCRLISASLTGVVVSTASKRIFLASVAHINRIAYAQLACCQGIGVNPQVLICLTYDRA